MEGFGDSAGRVVGGGLDEDDEAEGKKFRRGPATKQPSSAGLIGQRAAGARGRCRPGWAGG